LSPHHLHHVGGVNGRLALACRRLIDYLPTADSFVLSSVYCSSITIARRHQNRHHSYSLRLFRRSNCPSVRPSVLLFSPSLTQFSWRVFTAASRRLVKAAALSIPGGVLFLLPGGNYGSAGCSAYNLTTIFSSPKAIRAGAANV